LPIVSAVRVNISMTWSTVRYPKSCAPSALSIQNPILVGLVRIDS